MMRGDRFQSAIGVNPTPEHGGAFRCPCSLTASIISIVFAEDTPALGFGKIVVAFHELSFNGLGRRS
jgi:hypothetical protein